MTTSKLPFNTSTHDVTLVNIVKTRLKSFYLFNQAQKRAFKKIKN